MKKNNNGFMKFFAGAALGAGLGVLFAPKNGSDSREALMNKINELTAKVKEIDIKEVKDNLETKINDLKADIEDLDKEKALALAKKKAKTVQDKAEELFEYAMEKGTPALEKTADCVRKKAIETTKQILAKLEKEN